MIYIGYIEYVFNTKTKSYIKEANTCLLVRHRRQHLHHQPLHLLPFLPLPLSLSRFPCLALPYSYHGRLAGALSIASYLERMDTKLCTLSTDTFIHRSAALRRSTAPTRPRARSRCTAARTSPWPRSRCRSRPRCLARHRPRPS